MGTWFFLSEVETRKNTTRRRILSPTGTPRRSTVGGVGSLRKRPRRHHLIKILLLVSTLHLARPPSSPKPGVSGHRILLPALKKKILLYCSTLHLARPPSSPRPGFTGHTPATTGRAKYSLLYNNNPPFPDSDFKLSALLSSAISD